LLKGAVASSALVGAGALASCGELADGNIAATAPPVPAFSFDEIARGVDDTHHVPPGYEADIVLRWGDRLFADAPDFDPQAQTAAAQERQFGYNNDYVGFIPLGTQADGETRALLCINHEYTNTQLMFPGLGADPRNSMTAELCAVEMAANGGTIVEIAERNNQWTPIIGSRFNRRITATTPMEISGPASGHTRLQTNADPSGTRVLGTLGDCAGGITPWRSYLLAEENFQNNFLGELPNGHPEAESYSRYGIPRGAYAWGRFDKRFDVSIEPFEPNRFGWIVEVDPFDPNSVPKKRTALGRFKHEGAESVVAPDGRVVLYMGDDEQNNYVFKFVTAGRFDPDNHAANANLLDEGTLYVARFESDGRVNWLPLVYDSGPLNEETGFHSQADVLIDARRAADLLGATPMDRPEDVEPNAQTGRAYVMLTNNFNRGENEIDAANPRAQNAFGHIIEIIEPEGDFASPHSNWEILLRCGDPARPEFGASWNPATSANGWFGSPDNCAIDPAGRLWVSTDGNDGTGANDGLWAVSVAGEARGTSRAFFRAPLGAEVCGPAFSADGRSLFLAIQHPGDIAGASFENPGTRWPDFEQNSPVRPAVLAIRRSDGGVVGS
jgi:secreted PhoX family phosphatase